jgi:hypothetical protein
MNAAILDARPAVMPGIVTPANSVTRDLVRVFALDRLPVARHGLACHWRRDADGRIACAWEPDS